MEKVTLRIDARKECVRAASGDRRQGHQSSRVEVEISGMRSDDYAGSCGACELYPCVCVR